MILTILSLLLLFGPLIFELADDANGDTNKQFDVAIRIAIGLLASFVAWFTDGRNFLAAFNLSMSLHWLIFDYAINAILNRTVYEKKVNWFTHVGKSGVIDNLTFWKEMNPYVKLGIRVAYFLISVILYFVI